jgi:hypothetical protein
MTNPASTRAPKLRVEALEDRTVPTFLPSNLSPNALINGIPALQTGTGGASIAIGDLNPEGGNIARNEYVIATGPGTEGTVSVFSLLGTRENQFVAFAGYRGGLHVAVGDVIGTTRPEIIVATAGAGPSVVGVFTPDGQLLRAFYPFGEGYRGGLNVAAGNVLNDANPLDIGTGGGGPQPAVKSEIIVGAALGNAPHVKVLDGDGNDLRSFFAFDAGYLGGVTVAAASIDTTRVPRPPGQPRPPDTNSYAEIIVGAATNIPHIKIFSTWQGGQTELQSYYAFDPNDPSNVGGVTLAAGNTDGSRGAEIYVNLVGSSRVRAFAGESRDLLADFITVPDTYSRVVNMAVGNTGQFDPFDDDSFFGVGNTQDLAVVTGDGPYAQVPRYFRGAPGSAAGRNGP